ncbi:Kinesin-like protein, partial [Caligus rogercresseyi]
GFRRTTRDYEGPTVAPRVQAVLDAAMLNVEPDIELDVGLLNATQSVRGSIKVKKRLGGGGENRPQSSLLPTPKNFILPPGDSFLNENIRLQSMKTIRPNLTHPSPCLLATTCIN